MVTGDEIVGWHHQFNGHEFEQTLEDSKGQGSLACYSSPWTAKDLILIKIIYPIAFIMYLLSRLHSA